MAEIPSTEAEERRGKCDTDADEKERDQLRIAVCPPEIVIHEKADRVRESGEHPQGNDEADQVEGDPPGAIPWAESIEASCLMRSRRDSLPTSGAAMPSWSSSPIGVSLRRRGCLSSSCSATLGLSQPGR